MKRKILSGVLVVSLLFSIGCSSSYEVSSSANSHPSFNTFNAEMSDRRATIIFQDDRELDVRNITATPDSTHLLMEGDVTIVVPTHTVKKVVITNRGIGFLDGFAWGAGISATAAAVVALANGKGFMGADLASTTLFFAAMAGAGGGVVGGIVGVCVGHSYEYQFVTSANSTTIK